MATTPPTIDPTYCSSAITWISENKLGDIASILGIVISVVGFWITVHGVLKSKSAAESAKQAADTTRDNIRLLETIVDFSAAIAALEEMARWFIAGFDEAQQQGLPYDEMFAELTEEWQTLMDWQLNVAQSLPGRRGAGRGKASPLPCSR